MLPFAISIVSTVITLYLALFLPLRGWHWISAAVMALSCIILMHTTEGFQINRSYEKFEEYCEYCAEMKSWLTGFSIVGYERIRCIKERISDKISILRSANEKVL